MPARARTQRSVRRHSQARLRDLLRFGTLASSRRKVHHLPCRCTRACRYALSGMRARQTAQDPRPRRRSSFPWQEVASCAALACERTLYHFATVRMPGAGGSSACEPLSCERKAGHERAPPGALASLFDTAFCDAGETRPRCPMPPVDMVTCPLVQITASL